MPPKNWQKSGYSLLRKCPFWKKFAFTNSNWPRKFPSKKYDKKYCCACSWKSTYNMQLWMLNYKTVIRKNQQIWAVISLRNLMKYNNTYYTLFFLCYRFCTLRFIIEQRYHFYAVTLSALGINLFCVLTTTWVQKRG